MGAGGPFYVCREPPGEGWFFWAGMADSRPEAFDCTSEGQQSAATWARIGWAGSSIWMWQNGDLSDAQRRLCVILEATLYGELNILK